MAAREEEAAREAEAGALEVAAEDEERRAYEQFLEQERKRLERIPFQPTVLNISYYLYRIIHIGSNRHKLQVIMFIQYVLVCILQVHSRPKSAW